MGLFLLAGGAAGVALVAWARGNALRTGTPYQATIEFPLACGITVRERGAREEGRGHGQRGGAGTATATKWL